MAFWVSAEAAIAKRETEVREAVKNHINSVNAWDPEGITKACHFPHFRVMGDNITYNWASASALSGWFEERVGVDGRGYSELNSVNLEKLAEEKFRRVGRTLSL